VFVGTFGGLFSDKQSSAAELYVLGMQLVIVWAF
jgi:hypothetical protein